MLFKLRAQLAIFHGFEGLGDLLLVQLHGFGEIAFEIGDAAALSLDPFGAELLALAIEFARLRRGVALSLLEIVAHAMEIGDELCGFARRRFEHGAGALDHFVRQAEALGDVNTA